MKQPHEFDETNQPSHISYKDYKRKVTKNPNEGIIMFVSAFFVMLLLFLGIAKQISPEIDVSIGEDSNASTEDGISKTEVDNRLKLIQNEDNGENAQNPQNETFSPELDEKVRIPDNLKKAADTTEETKQNEEKPITLPEKVATPKPADTAAIPPKAVTPPPAQHNVNAKVVVGYYTTAEQAQVAKGIISEAGLNINPFVRNIGGAYTIQVGSYSTREKAQSVANELLRNNYPARIIIEQ